MGQVELGGVSFLAHGTTVIINALTERTGARTALITTRGFRDVLEIQKANLSAPGNSTRTSWWSSSSKSSSCSPATFRERDPRGCRSRSVPPPPVPLRVACLATVGTLALGPDRAPAAPSDPGRSGFEGRLKVGMDRDPTRGGVKFLRGDVRVSADGGEVGVAEVGGDKTRIASFLAKPGGGCVGGACAPDLLVAGPARLAREGRSRFGRLVLKSARFRCS